MPSQTTSQIGLIQMAEKLGWRRPSAFGDEGYCLEILKAYHAKHGGSHAARA